MWVAQARSSHAQLLNKSQRPLQQINSKYNDLLSGEEIEPKRSQIWKKKYLLKETVLFYLLSASFGKQSVFNEKVLHFQIIKTVILCMQDLRSKSTSQWSRHNRKASVEHEGIGDIIKRKLSPLSHVYHFPSVNTIMLHDARSQNKHYNTQRRQAF